MPYICPEKILLSVILFYLGKGFENYMSFLGEVLVKYLDVFEKNLVHWNLRLYVFIGMTSFFIYIA